MLEPIRDRCASRPVLEPGFLHLPFEHAELVTQGKVLEREVAT